MENKLKSLFEYQRFAGNPKLDKLIKETKDREGRMLSDDELYMINAASNIIRRKQEDIK